METSVLTEKSRAILEAIEKIARDPQQPPSAIHSRLTELNLLTAESPGGAL